MADKRTRRRGGSSISDTDKTETRQNNRKVRGDRRKQQNNLTFSAKSGIALVGVRGFQGGLLYFLEKVAITEPKVSKKSDRLGSAAARSAALLWTGRCACFIQTIRQVSCLLKGNASWRPNTRSPTLVKLEWYFHDVRAHHF